jgi:hypothetical protein
MSRDQQSIQDMWNASQEYYLISPDSIGGMGMV